ncbi:MAG: hypothetical protein K2M42_00610 [Oscillospiraceae bacterium]|nr:hypothetical protein [Oscillospiraceae bacterium]
MTMYRHIELDTLFAALDELVAADPPQMELHCGIGRLVSGRRSKGAAIYWTVELLSLRGRRYFEKGTG